MALERLEPYARKPARTVLRGAGHSHVVGLLDHGHDHLSHVFGLLMFLAFLIDQAQQRCCALFQAALKRAKGKKRLWRKLIALFTEFYIQSWEDVWTWIAGGHGAKLRMDTS
jgi:hypothetical protein